MYVMPTSTASDVTLETPQPTSHTVCKASGHSKRHDCDVCAASGAWLQTLNSAADVRNSASGFVADALTACRPGCALNRPTWSPVKGGSARVSPNRLSYGCPTTIFLVRATDTDIVAAQHFWTGGLETAGPGCYDAVAIARAAGFRMLVMSRIRHAVIVL